jgi:hypothetical protein
VTRREANEARERYRSSKSRYTGAGRDLAAWKALIAIVNAEGMIKDCRKALKLRRLPDSVLRREKLAALIEKHASKLREHKKRLRDL